MRENQVYAKKKKCYFRQKEVPYLGHIVSEEGIKMDPKKVEAIKNWPEIKSIKQLQAFLGLMGYYCKFIANYAHHAKPLTNLLKKESVHEWENEHDQAKAALIKVLTEAPLLKSPDYSKPFVVTCDASSIALGAVLSQDDKPIAFLSKTFSSQEQNWTIYEKELFAVIYALRKWEHYLQTQVPFTIITDNSAVSAIQTQAKISPKQARWLSFMDEFNFTIVHRPGTENKVADAISRRDIFGITTVSNQPWLERLRQLSAKVPIQKWMRQEDGLIYKDQCLYVPGYRDVKTTIIKECHQGLGGGHLGRLKTLEKVTRGYYWEKMNQDITKFIKSCDICQ
jgi:hypothetical protein